MAIQPAITKCDAIISIVAEHLSSLKSSDMLTIQICIVFCLLLWFFPFFKRDECGKSKCKRSFLCWSVWKWTTKHVYTFFFLIVNVSQLFDCYQKKKLLCSGIIMWPKFVLSTRWGRYSTKIVATINIHCIQFICKVNVWMFEWMNECSNASQTDISISIPFLLRCLWIEILFSYFVFDLLHMVVGIAGLGLVLLASDWFSSLSLSHFGSGSDSDSDSSQCTHSDVNEFI